MIMMKLVMKSVNSNLNAPTSSHASAAKYRLTVQNTVPSLLSQRKKPPKTKTNTKTDTYRKTNTGTGYLSRTIPMLVAPFTKEEIV